MDKHGYTGYIGVYRVYSITRVSMGTHKIYSGIQGVRDNIWGSLYGDCHELLALPRVFDSPLRILPACRRLLFALLHAEKGRPFSACNIGNRRRLHAGNSGSGVTPGPIFDLIFDQLFKWWITVSTGWTWISRKCIGSSSTFCYKINLVPRALFRGFGGGKSALGTKWRSRKEM